MEKLEEKTEATKKQDKLKILVVPANDGGCAYFRAWAPFNKLQELHKDEVEVKFNKNPLGIEEGGPNAGKWKPDWEFEDMKWADIVFTQNLSNFGGPYTARIIGKAKEFGKITHYDTDDLLTDVYEGHRLHGVYKEKNLGEITKFIYNNSDLVTVTQRKFAERVLPFIGKNTTLAVVKNAIDYNLPCWNMQKIPSRKVCRFGWVGGIHHEEDLKEFTSVPHLVNQKAGRERVSWARLASWVSYLVRPLHFRGFGQPSTAPNLGRSFMFTLFGVHFSTQTSNYCLRNGLENVGRGAPTMEL